MLRSSLSGLSYSGLVVVLRRIYTVSLLKLLREVSTASLLRILRGVSTASIRFPISI